MKPRTISAATAASAASASTAAFVVAAPTVSPWLTAVHLKSARFNDRSLTTCPSLTFPRTFFSHLNEERKKIEDLLMVFFLFNRL